MLSDATIPLISAQAFGNVYQLMGQLVKSLALIKLKLS